MSGSFPKCIFAGSHAVTFHVQGVCLRKRKEGEVRRSSLSRRSANRALSFETVAHSSERSERTESSGSWGASHPHLAAFTPPTTVNCPVLVLRLAALPCQVGQSARRLPLSSLVVAVGPRGERCCFRCKERMSAS